MPTTVTIPSPETFVLPRARVYTAETLTTGDGWTERPYLYVDLLAILTAPDIGYANLSDHSGEFPHREPELFDGEQQSGQFDPLDLIRHYCKIEIIDKYDDDAVLKTWYGIIEVDSRDLANDETTPANRTGQVRLVAYDLLRELDTTFITGSRVQDADGNPQTIGRGLTFNKYLGHAFPERANRTEFTIPDGDYDGYIFSWSPTQMVGVSSSLQAAKWTAAQAARYLLNYFPPLKEDGDPTATWSLVGIGDPTVEDYTDWYDITAETERRSVKSVLDELFPRQRLVGYFVEGREDDDEFIVEIKVFSFAETAIAMPEGGTLEANGDLIELEQGISRIVQQPVLRINATVQADVIRVEGAYITSTITLRYGVDELGKGWTDVQEADYGLADSQGRERDALRDVYSRFVAADTWPMTIDNGNGFEMNVVLKYEDLPETIENEDLPQLFIHQFAVAEQGKWWFRGKRFLHHLALKDENSGEYRRPLVAFAELDEDGEPTDSWILGEVVSVSGERDFNTHLRLVDETLGVRIIVNIPGGQHMIARGVFSGDVGDGPDPETGGGLSYEHMRVTVTFEWDDRVRIEERVDTPEGHDRVRIIIVPDARLDFLLQGTVTDIADDATLERSEDGEVLRDDRDRLRAIAKAAAAWYGTPRNAITLPYADLREHLQLGQLITKLKQGTEEVDVNTPVTGITFDFLRGSCTVETSYADADFVTGQGAEFRG